MDSKMKLSFITDALISLTLLL